MSKMSKRERKIYNLGKQAGYYEGYSKGLYDGNPFNAIMESIHKLCTMFEDTELQRALLEASQEAEHEVE